VSAAVPSSGWAPSTPASLVLFVATALGCFLCYRLALPFLPALAWALALAVLFAPLQRWLETKLNRPSLAAFISVTVIGLIVVVPFTFMAERLIGQATKAAELVQRQVGSGEWRSALQAQPRLASLVARVDHHFDLPGATKTATTWLSASAGPIVKGSVTQLVGFVLTFYLLFFFLRDRHAALAALRRLSPLTDPEMDRLFGRVGDTIHATVYGTLAVSAIQGLLGGLMFWWLGLPAPLLWGFVMALLAVVPMLGAFVVWAPAAVFLAFEGNLGRALILTLWGALVVGMIDNLLRPILVGNRLKLHTVLAFIAVVGGIILFGAAGLILGPVVLTVTIVLLDTWSARSVRPNSKFASPPAP
jgi:predicted PurR-regulated permease PerM